MTENLTTEAPTAGADLLGQIVKVTTKNYATGRSSSLHMKVYKVVGGQAFGQIMHKRSDGSGFVQYRNNTAMRSLRCDKFEVVG